MKSTPRPMARLLSLSHQPSGTEAKEPQPNDVLKWSNFNALTKTCEVKPFTVHQDFYWIAVEGSVASIFLCGCDAMDNI